MGNLFYDFGLYIMLVKNINSQKLSETAWAYAMISPLLVGIFIFFYGGMLYSLIISFTNYNPIINTGEFIFFKNYLKIFTDHILLKSLWNTIIYVLIGVPLLIIFSIFIAILISEQKNPKFELFLKFIFFLPNITLPVALSLTWKYMFNPLYGMINKLLALFSIHEVPWYTEKFPAFFMIILLVVWQGSGYCILLLTVAIKNIPVTYFEASGLEGVTTIQKSRYIIIPLISPTIFFLIITATIAIFQIFDPILVITKGGPVDSTRSVMFSVYTEIGQLKIGLASAISWIVFIIIMIVTILQSKGQKKWVHYES